MGKAALLFGAVALAATAAGEDVLLIGDYASQAVYERSLDEGRGTARLASGRVNFVADQLSIASDRFSFYAVDHAIVEFDRTGRALARIHDVPETTLDFRLNAGPGENLVSLLAIAGSDARVIEGTRADADSPWTFEDAGLSLSPTGTNTPSTLDFAQVQAGTWVGLLHDSGTKVVVARKSAPDNPVTITVDSAGQPDRTMRVERGPNGQWVLYSDTNARAATIHDADGNLLKTIPTDGGTVFSNGVRAFDWFGGANAGAEYVTRTGIDATGDPLATNPIATLLHTFLGAGGKVDVFRDLSDSTEFRRRGDGRGWRAGRDGLGLLVDVNRTSGEQGAVFCFERGTGPTLGPIVDMIAVADKLLVLCNSSPQTIFEVNRATGGRRLHALLAGEAPFDAIARKADGTILLSRREARPGGMTSKWHVVRAISAIDENATATLLPVAEAEGDGMHFALGLDPQERAVVAMLPLDGPPARRQDGAALVRAGEFSLVAAAATQTTFNQQTVSGTFDWLGNGGSPNAEGFQLFARGTVGSQASFAQGLQSRIQWPGTTLSESPSMQFPHGAAAPFPVRMVVRHRLGSAVLPAGNLTASFQFSGTIPSSLAWSEVELAEWLPNISAGVPLGDSLLVARHTPPRLTTIDLDSGEWTDLALAAGDGFVQPADLNAIGELFVDPGSGDVFAALRENARVLRIDPATGVATEFVSGRPLEMDAELLGLGPQASLSLAVGPHVDPVSAEETFSVY